MCQEMCLLHELRSCPQKYKPFTYISTISLNKFIQKISETNKKFRGGERRERFIPAYEQLVHCLETRKAIHYFYNYIYLPTH